MAFVPIETYTTQLGAKVWEGQSFGFSQNRRGYRIFTPATGTVLEMRNVMFFEAPPYSHLPTKLLDFLDDDEES